MLWSSSDLYLIDVELKTRVLHLPDLSHVTYISYIARDFETFKSLTVYKTSDLLALGFSQVQGCASSHQQHVLTRSIRDSGECVKPLVVSSLMSYVFYTLNYLK